MMRTTLRLGAACLLIVLGVQPLPADGPCTSWQTVNPVPSGNHLYGAAYSAGRWVAVGRRGTILESPDRVSWQQVPSPTSRTLRSVAVNGSRFVAVADGGEVLTSDQPGEWSSLGVVWQQDLYGVTAGPSGFVAVGGFASILTSPDGTTWAPAEIAGGRVDTLYAVTWTGALYVAVGANESIVTSPDGVVWTRRSYDENTLFATELTGVAGNESLVVAAGLGTVQLVSSDGITWNELDKSSDKLDADADETAVAKKALPRQDYPTAAIWCDPYLFVGPVYGNDGVSWVGSQSDGRSGDHVNGNGFACGENGSLLLVGGGGHIAVSDDHGAHFRSVNAMDDWWVLLAAWDGERLVARAADDERDLILSSNDGISWQETEIWSDWPWVALVAGGSGFVSAEWNEVEETSTIFTSATGESWRQVWSGPGLADITWDGSRYVAVGRLVELVGFSDNGSDWQLSQPGAERRLSAVASNQEIVVAVGGSAVVVTSDGTDWQETYEDSSATLHDIAWGGGLFVAVGTPGRIITSPDGVEWTQQSLSTSNTLRRVIWTGDGFLAIGELGSIAASSDGSSWQLVDTGTDRDLREVCRNGDGVTVFGSAGLIMRSACTGSQDDPPSAAFSALPAAPAVGQPVHCADLSTGAPTSWQWDLGDSSTAEGNSVTHAYTAPGTYPVTLTASNANGSSSMTRSVVVSPACGTPTVPQLEAPMMVAGGEHFTVSWNDVGAMSYHLQNAADPLFLGTRVSDCTLDRSGMAAECSSDWRDTRSVFLRLRAFNTCSDGYYYSDWSETREVLVRRSLEQLDVQQLVIPAAAHTPGLAGTNWLTDLSLYNPHAMPVEAALTLLHGSDSQESGTELVLRAGRATLLADVVATMLPETAATGAILIDSSLPLVAFSRTYNDQPQGSFGQAIAAAPAVSAIPGGERRRLIGLQRSTAARSNLGFANPSSEPITVTTELFSGDGAAIGSRQDEVGAWDHLQLTDILGKQGVAEDSSAYAVVSAAGAANGFFAYASVIDNQTGDSIAITPAEPTTAWSLTATKPLSGVWFRVLCNNGRYIAWGRDRLATSWDGRSWQEQELSLGFADLVVTDTRWVGVGHDLFASSTDGSSWQTVAWDGQLNAVTWTGTHWVAVGDAGAVAVSNDGETWIAYQAGENDLEAVAWTGERLVAVGNQVIATSTDGVSWSIESSALHLNGVIWGGRIGLAWNSWFDAMLRSTDGGDTWAPVGPTPSVMVWAGDRFVAIRGSRITTSSDGEQWQDSGVTPPYMLSNLSWDGERVVSVTRDGHCIWLQPERSDLVVPAAARGGGVNGSQWRSDLVLHNSSDSTLETTLELLELNRDNSTPRSTSLSVPAGTSREIGDVLSNLFDFTGVAGLRATTAGTGLQISSRTYTDIGAGTYGQHIPAHTAGDAIHFYERGYLTQLASTAGFRTNLGLLSACAWPMTVEVELAHADGSPLATRSFQLQPYELQQHNGILSWGGQGAVPLATATLSTSTPGCAFFAYASVIDNGSNDPIFIPATRLLVDTSPPEPDTPLFDNRANAIVVDELEGAAGTDALQSGRFVAAVSAAGNLGRLDQLLRVVCLYTNSHGQQRGVSLGHGESVSDVAGDGPFWCFIADWSSCQDNNGEALVTLSDDDVELSYRLDARDSCTALAELPETVSIPRMSYAYDVLTTGDLGAAERLPQVLLLLETYYGRDLLRSRVVGAGSTFQAGRYESDFSAYAALAVVLDLHDRSDNSGITELVSR